MTTVLDTNALMMPVECDVRLFDELARLDADDELLVPRAVVDELETLAAGAGKEARAASVGRDLVDRCEIRDTEADYADNAVVELATGGATVDDSDAGVDYAVTNDRPLRERLLAENVPVIGLRGRAKLAITRP